ncbi:MAG: PQQ-binding-like beta-propeller repeat protein [Candidatus Altiarchaeota archaeon]|nr:PQQ-binding-like beta-propeller repeat protein [Candidatus Altiarchaeota archaeon]
MRRIHNRGSKKETNTLVKLLVISLRKKPKTFVRILTILSILGIISILIAAFIIFETINNINKPAPPNETTATTATTTTIFPHLVIGNCSVSRIMEDSVVITWTTDKESDSVVEYGTSVHYGLSEKNPVLGREHIIKLTGLDHSTQYHYRVKSTDKDHNFTTAYLYEGEIEFTGNKTVIDADSTHTHLEIKTKRDITANLVIVKYLNNYLDEFPLHGIEKYIRIDSDELEGNIESAVIRIDYTDQEIKTSGLDENSLRLYRYHPDLKRWMELNESMEWVHGTGLVVSKNYLWANLTKFSVYAIGGLLDETPPVVQYRIPSGIITEEEVTIDVNTNEISECRYDNNDVVYSLMTEGFNATNGTHHSRILTLPDGTYNYHVRCMDFVGNVNTKSELIKFTVSLGGKTDPPGKDGGVSGGKKCRGVCSITSPGCSDGIHNQGEGGIDCGGPCPPCPKTRYNLLWNYTTEDEILDAEISYYGDYIAAGSGNKLYLLSNEGDLIWNRSVGEGIIDVELSINANYTGALFTPIKTPCGDSFYLLDRGNRLEWKLNEIPCYGWGDEVVSLDITPYTNNIVIGANKYIYSFDGEGDLLWNRSVKGYVNGVIMSYGAGEVIAWSNNSYLYFLNEDGELVWGYKTGGSIYSVSATTDGKRIAAGSKDGNVYFFDKTGKLLWTFEANDSVLSVSMTPDGKFIAVGSVDKNVYLLNKSGGLLWSYRTLWSVTSVDLTHDASSIGAGSRDKKLYLFDIKGNLVWNFTTDDEITVVRIPPNGVYLLAGSRDKRVYLFKIGRTKSVKDMSDVKCFLDIDCGGEDVYYCRDGNGDGQWDVALGSRTYRCKNPGRKNAYCSPITRFERTVDYCRGDEVCISGEKRCRS